MYVIVQPCIHRCIVIQDFHLSTLNKGFGKSKSKRLSDSAIKVKVIQQVIDDLHLDRPLIVSPSMSGSYAIPFLMQSEPKECTKRSRGFIPVAPASSDSYTEEQYAQCEVGTVWF